VPADIKARSSAVIAQETRHQISIDLTTMNLGKLIHSRCPRKATGREFGGYGLIAQPAHVLSLEMICSRNHINTLDGMEFTGQALNHADIACSVGQKEYERPRISSVLEQSDRFSGRSPR
jgi:hypothetical protein